LIQLIELEMFASPRGRTLLALPRAPRLLLLLLLLLLMMMMMAEGGCERRGKSKKCLLSLWWHFWLQVSARLLVPMAALDE